MFVLITGFGGEGSERVKNRGRERESAVNKHVLPELYGRKEWQHL